MPATKFICPDGRQVDIKKCLQKCINAQRCMFLPTLRAIAQSLDRGIKDPTVTELLCGVRETYLKKTTEYAIRPHDQLYAIHGSAQYIQSMKDIPKAIYLVKNVYMMILPAANLTCMGRS